MKLNEVLADMYRREFVRKLGAVAASIAGAVVVTKAGNCPNCGLSYSGCCLCNTPYSGCREQCSEGPYCGWEWSGCFECIHDQYWCQPPGDFDCDACQGAFCSQS
jgi:hypothetical protein